MRVCEQGEEKYGPAGCYLLTKKKKECRKKLVTICSNWVIGPFVDFLVKSFQHMRPVRRV